MPGTRRSSSSTPTSGRSSRGAPQQRFALRVGGIERLDAKLLERDVLGGPQGGDGAEQPGAQVPEAQLQRDDHRVLRSRAPAPPARPAAAKAHSPSARSSGDRRRPLRTARAAGASAAAPRAPALRRARPGRSLVTLLFWALPLVDGDL